ncbi:MAG: glycine cleavage system protein GcvH [Sulfuricella sp.]|nr:glycine cleavage system protein GcvH [Sulfuricella sp.]
MTIPADLKYTASHEWVRLDADGSLSIGITDHAQQLLGDLVYVEPPAVGRQLAAGEECAVVESVKSASDVYAPLAGTVTAANDELSGAPEKVNQDAYGAWIFRLQPDDPAAFDKLLDAAAYQAVVDAEEH